MAIIYTEVDPDGRKRPGVYQRFVNRDNPASRTEEADPGPGPDPPGPAPGPEYLVDEWSLRLLDEKERILMDEESDIA